MFPFSKEANDHSLTAIIPQQSGLSIASVKQDSGHNPVLSACEFVSWNSGAAGSNLLQDKVKQYGLTRKHCTTTLELGDYSVLSVEAPDVPSQELRQAIRWQIKDLIDYHVDDAVLDVFDAPASGVDGRQHNLYVVVSRLAIVQQRVNALQDVEVNLTTIDIPELVLRNITARLPEDETGVALVYLTKNTGLLVLTRANTLYLARSLDIGYETLQEGAAGDNTEEPESFNPVYDRLVLELQRSLDYYDRYFVQPPISGIVFAPARTDLSGLSGYVTSNLGIASRILDLNELMKSDIQIKPEDQADCLLAIAAAMRTEKKTL